MAKKYTHIDLFAGPGGICTGFKSLGIKTVIANEYIDTTCETYSANHPDVKMLCKDIRHVSNAEIKQQLSRISLSGVDIVSAGFPCETFSTAGNKSRVYNDHRNFLYKEAIRIADAANAKILLLENVPAFLSKRITKKSETKVIDCLIQDLKEFGFKYFIFDVLNAADYGVPQNRKRFILLASKNIDVRNYDLVGNTQESKVTAGDAFSDLPKIQQGSASNQYLFGPKNDFQKIVRDPDFWKTEKPELGALTYHITTKHRPTTVERFELINQGEGLKHLFSKLSKRRIKDLQKKKVLPARWYIQRNYRLKKNDQSRTITSHCLDEVVHPTLNRSLSVREVARLQSFPDHYDFKGGPLVCPHIYKTQDKFEQIGDAVPPLLARHVGKRILDILTNTNLDHVRSKDRIGVSTALPAKVV